MSNYAKPIPIDRNLNAMMDYPPNASALAAVTRENSAVSSVTAFTPNTTTIEVAAITAGAAIKWTSSQATSVVTASSGANYDHVITAGTVRKFVVPQTQMGAMASIVGLNTLEGLFPAVATIGLGTGSVLLTQY